MEKIISYLTAKNFTISLSGLQIKVLDAAVLDAGPHWEKEAHFHTYFEFHMIKSGKGTVSIEGSTLPFQEGDFYITGPYVTHQQVSDPEDPLVEYCLQCKIRLSDTPDSTYFLSSEDTEFFINVLSATYPRTFQDNYGAMGLFDSIIKETSLKLPGFSLQIQPLLFLLVISLFRSVITTLDQSHVSNPQSDVRVSRIINFIENNYHLSPTIDDLSKLIFLSPKQINRIMKKHFDCTFHEKLLLYKVLQAKHLLSHSTLSIEAIAAACGFSSHYYMYQVFKRFDLPPPARFRITPSN
ncbi:AraC family transcriptional regulator [Paenibacillus sp. Marseille-Q4541]|uniref:AraC family transcriptional regulator n=1 Tax=Paenibacillus sp. Marseille-Q4541 TaxID=2831522 RepID=UPI001BAB7E29|nr:AraC family transcriptional regulator [Paenibacillus sp. Marseille-Q4541]